MDRYNGAGFSPYFLSRKCSESPNPSSSSLLAWSSSISLCDLLEFSLEVGGCLEVDCLAELSGVSMFEFCIRLALPAPLPPKPNRRVLAASIASLSALRKKTNTYYRLFLRTYCHVSVQTNFEECKKMNSLQYKNTNSTIRMYSSKAFI